jgi:hypothetical protein
MIVRAAHDKDNPFFQMSRDTAQDANLPARALGVLAYLLSKPDSWEPTIDDICRRFSDVGRDQAYKIITEIFVPLRYARRTQERVEGKFARWLTEIHESPLPENQEAVTPDTDQPDTENQEMASRRKVRKSKKSKNVTPFPENQEAASPFPDLPDTEKPDPENQDLYKKRKYKLQRKDITEGNTTGAVAPAGSLTRDECYSLFCELRQSLGDYEAPYQKKKADFIHLEALYKNCAQTNWALTRERFTQAARYYFATPRSAHTLADLAANFSEFFKHPLDRFGKPVDVKSAALNGFSPAAQQTIAAATEWLQQTEGQSQ